MLGEVAAAAKMVNALGEVSPKFKQVRSIVHRGAFITSALALGMSIGSALEKGSPLAFFSPAMLGISAGGIALTLLTKGDVIRPWYVYASDATFGLSTGYVGGRIRVKDTFKLGRSEKIAIGMAGASALSSTLITIKGE